MAFLSRASSTRAPASWAQACARGSPSSSWVALACGGVRILSDEVRVELRAQELHAPLELDREGVGLDVELLRDLVPRLLFEPDRAESPTVDVGKAVDRAHDDVAAVLVGE